MSLTDTSLTFYFKCAKCGYVMLSAYDVRDLCLKCKLCIMEECD